jgi:uncharacterized membrane protein
MAHAEDSIVINRPVKDVYDFVLDGTKNQLWRPAVTDVERVPGKPSEAGAIYKQGLKGPGGRRIEGDYEITECMPNEMIKFQVVAGPARPTGTYKFEDVGNATRVTFTLDYQPTGFEEKLMDPMINRTMKGEVTTLSNLKSYMESQPS